MGYKILRYITKEEHDSIEYRIENRKFHVRIKYIDTLDHEFIKEYGHVTNDLEEDTISNLNLKVKCAYSVLQLATILNKGLAFYLINESEEHEMYNLIREYIRYWTDKANNNLFIKNIPFDKLNALSDLGTMLYKIRDRRKDYKYNSEVEIRKQFGQFDSTIPSLNEILKLKPNAFSSSKNSNILTPIENKVESKKEEFIPHLNDIEILDSIFKERKDWELKLKQKR